MVICQIVNCVLQAFYGKVHHKPLFCKSHRKNSHWDVAHKLCESDGCQKQPSFGLEVGKRLSCGQHKLDGYVDVKNKRCVAGGCQKNPVFGLVWGKAISCGQHKLDGYVNVKTKRCVAGGCQKQPAFGLELGKPLSCGQHKLDGYVNVKNKRCVAGGCQKQPAFGLVLGKPLSCFEHKLGGYVDVKSKRCVSDGCLIRPYYGIVWGKQLACRSHAPGNYVNVRSTRCRSPACTVLPIIERSVANYKVDGLLLCGSCIRSMHPDLAKKFKVRTEHFVLAELQRRMPELEETFLSWDCPLPCAISTERADMLWQIGSTLLHVEVDEIATHEDDRNRLMRLLAATDSVDHIVVRIHTHCYDNYKPCVTKSQMNGEWVVACREKEFGRRMDIVVPEIKRLLAAKESVVKVMFLD